MEETLDRQKQALEKLISREYKHALRRLETCRQQLETSLQWENLHHQAQLLQANLYRIKKGMKEIIVPDWCEEGNERTIELNPRLEPHTQAKLIFRQSKKQKAAIPHLEKQVEIRQQLCTKLQLALQRLEAVKNDIDLNACITESFQKKATPSPKRKKEPPLPYHEFHSSTGLAIRVGKGAKSNDILTFSQSKGSDWWFHVRDYPGSHVVLCVTKGQEPDDEALRDAMLLALTHSKARNESEAEITVTQCKHVNRFKNGPPGKVQIGQHKVMSVRNDPERLKLIKTRSYTIPKK